SARVIDDVFQDRAKALGRRVDLRFGILVDPDRLRVAAAFEVEDAAVAPSVLVIADKAARGISRKRGLAGPAQTKEQGGVRTIRVCVGRAMHRKDVLRREQVVERGENRLLDLACVTGAADDDDPPAEVDQDERLTARAVSLRLGLER